MYFKKMCLCVKMMKGGLAIIIFERQVDQTEKIKKETIDKAIPNK